MATRLTHVTLDTVPAGVLLEAYLNGRSTGIIESNPEYAFTYWAGRARKGKQNAEANGERRPRVYHLVRKDTGVVYDFVNDGWRAR